MGNNQIPCAAIGTVLDSGIVTLTNSRTEEAPQVLLSLPITQLKEAWQAPLRWQ